MTAPTLWPHQKTALDNLTDLYTSGVDRATVAMPCGTGKTLVEATLAHTIGGRCVVFVPTVNLLEQVLGTFADSNPGVPVVAVCSEALLDDGVVQSHLARQHGLEVTTSPDDLADLLTTTPVIVIATYASSDVIATASTDARITWDLLICDEAHRTAGFAHRHWSIPVDNTLIPARHRAFFTATTRTVTPPQDVSDVPDPEDIRVVSMDSETSYGPHIPTLTLRDAINAGLLSDYRVSIIGVSDTSVMEIIDDTSDNNGLDPYAAASQLALLQARDTHPDLQSVMVFHNRINDSRRWCEQFQALAEVENRGDVDIFHVDAHTPAHVRAHALRRLADPGDSMAVVSNCRLFAEGVNVPALDGVVFAAPRSSTVDIVQIVGRALRRHPHRPDQPAHIILPIIVPSDGGEDTEVTALSRSSFLATWQVLMSMAEVDESVHKSAARLQMQAVGNPPPSDPGDDTDVIDIDTSMLAEGAAVPFALKTLSPLTSHHPQTVAHLHSWFVHNGDANPPTTAVWKTYPLGRRVASARQLHAASRLDPRVQALYETVPGFEWAPTKRRTRSADDWIDLMETYLSATSIGTITPYSKVTDPETGDQAAIGQRLHNFRWRRKLTEAQRQRLERLGVMPG